MRYRLYNADTLNRYAKDCHLRSVAKGFWDEKHSVGHCLMLAFGELHKAIEADNMGEWAKTALEQVNCLDELDDASYARMYLCLVKGTVEEKMTNAVIRLLNLLGSMIEDSPLSKDEVISAGTYPLYITEEITLADPIWYIIVETCARLHCWYTYRYIILYCINLIERICDHFGIDLVKYINLRLKYDDTRSAAGEDVLNKLR